MDKYVRVDWPESQEWYYYMECYIAPLGEQGAYIAFVPEELYNKVKGE